MSIQILAVNKVSFLFETKFRQATHNNDVNINIHTLYSKILDN